MSHHITRRSLIKASAASAAILAMGTNFAHAQGSDRIRVGMVGAGPRGRGAARDCTEADRSVEIVAIAEMFPDKLEEARKNLKETLGGQYKVTDDRCFLGFDAYKNVIDSDVDLVLLCSPPGFRPMHIRYAVEKGRHIFAEKPVATDAAGCRSIIESAKMIEEKKLSFVCGTQRRHMPSYIECIERIHNGEIGEITGGQATWCQGGVRMFPRQPEWSDLEWQLRNWWYFVWLSGDHNVEQHIHNMDVINWAIGSPPTSAYGMGGRQVRVDPAYGHTYDHFAIEYTYANGAKVTSMSRQIDGTEPRIGEWIKGTKGAAEPRKGIVKGVQNFRYNGDQRMSVGMNQEHVDLINSIRGNGPRLNEAKRIAETTLTMIMGRMSAYTGKQVTWEQAMESKESLFPEKLDFASSYPTPPVPTPGKTPLI